MSDPYQIYKNGRRKALASASLSLFSRGVLFGEGFFETLLVQNKKPVFLEEHLDRLFNGMQFMGSKTLPDQMRMHRSILRLTQKSGYEKARLKIICLAKGKPLETLWDEPLGFDWFALMTPLQQRRKRNAGIKLMPVAQSFCNPMNIFKTMQYMQSGREMRAAKKAGYDDIVYVYKDQFLLESSIANIFFMKDRKLVTPSLDLPILGGITRQKILDAASQSGYRVSERKVRIKELKDFHQAFLSNSTQGVRRIERIGSFHFKQSPEGLEDLVRAYQKTVSDSLEKCC